MVVVVVGRKELQRIASTANEINTQSRCFFCYETVSAAHLFDRVNSGLKAGNEGVKR